MKEIIIIFLITILFFSCNKDEEHQRNRADVSRDFTNLSIGVGINDVSFESINEGVFWDMRIIVPASASNTNKVPLIISLHGGASQVSELYKDSSCLLEPGFENLDAILIRPNSNGDLWFEGANQLQITAIVELASQHLAVDVSKIAITGYSDGAIGAWYYAQHYSDLFSASIPISGLYNTVDNSGNITPIATPLYVIHGTEDQLFNYDTSLTLTQESIDAGSNITFVTAQGLEHYNSCAYTPYLIDAVDWLENTIWN